MTQKRWQGAGLDVHEAAESAGGAVVTADKDEARKGGKGSKECAKSVASGAGGSKSKESKKEEKGAEKGTLAQRRAQVLSLLALLSGTKVLYWYKSRRWRRRARWPQRRAQGLRLLALMIQKYKY
jgi:hypothetical protein